MGRGREKGGVSFFLLGEHTLFLILLILLHLTLICHALLFSP